MGEQRTLQVGTRERQEIIAFNRDLGLRRQLAQNRINSTTATSIYSPRTGVVGIITKIVLCNVSGGATDFYLYHDDDGTTYDESTALAWNVALATDIETSRDYPEGLGVAYGGNLAFKTDTANSVTITIYGYELSVN